MEIELRDFLFLEECLQLLLFLLHSSSIVDQVEFSLVAFFTVLSASLDGLGPVYLGFEVQSVYLHGLHDFFGFFNHSLFLFL